jgi:hypothetical protein
MALEIIWTETSDEHLDDILENLEDKWTEREIEQFLVKLALSQAYFSHTKSYDFMSPRPNGSDPAFALLRQTGERIGSFRPMPAGKGRLPQNT